jgi:alpha-galactosidase
MTNVVLTGGTFCDATAIRCNQFVGEIAGLPVYIASGNSFRSATINDPNVDGTATFSGACSLCPSGTTTTTTTAAPTTAAPAVSNYKPIKSKVRDNYCLAVPESKKDNGVQMIMWNCNNGDDQQFKLETNNTIVAKHSGKCLDLDTSKGIIQQWECHGGSNQQWEYDAQGRLKSKGTNKCIDIPGGSGAIGTGVIQWDCHDGNNQKWSF